jgi:ribonuclease T2
MQGKSLLSSVGNALIGALLLIALSSAVEARGHGNRGGETRPGRFDYYLLSLSWSPSYCLTHADETPQCGGKGYGFVLHGLWPQNRNGSWPQHCRSSKEPGEEVITEILPIMPSRHLVEHEWETHGTCSGLDPKGYFSLAEDAFSRIAIPPALTTPATPPSLSADDIVQAFSDLNPGLDESMISIECKNGGELEEVHICLDKDNLSVRSCGGRVRSSCRAGKLKIPAVREVH